MAQTTYLFLCLTLKIRAFTLKKPHRPFKKICSEQSSRLTTKPHNSLTKQWRSTSRQVPTSSPRPTLKISTLCSKINMRLTFPILHLIWLLSLLTVTIRLRLQMPAIIQVAAETQATLVVNKLLSTTRWAACSTSSYQGRLKWKEFCLKGSILSKILT